MPAASVTPPRVITSRCGTPCAPGFSTDWCSASGVVVVAELCGWIAAGMVLGLALLTVVAAVVMELADGSLYNEPPCRCPACLRAA
jgi:hypothetical protein